MIAATFPHRNYLFRPNRTWYQLSLQHSWRVGTKVGTFRDDFEGKLSGHAWLLFPNNKIVIDYGAVKLCGIGRVVYVG